MSTKHEDKFGLEYWIKPSTKKHNAFRAKIVLLARAVDKIKLDLMGAEYKLAKAESDYSNFRRAEDEQVSKKHNKATAKRRPAK